jgi:dienelactone hydrolase
MGHRRTAWVAAALLVWAVPSLAWATGGDVSDVEVGFCHPPAPVCEPFAPLGWEGDHRSQRVELPSARTGAQLRGTLFAPPASHARRGGSPVVVIVPGSGGTAREENYHWSARELAANGYVVLGVDPQGIGRSGTFGTGESCEVSHASAEYPYPCEGVPFQQDENFIDAHLSGVDFLLGSDNPWGELVDTDRVGLAGHSLGAGAAAVAQERDERIDAIVAWDSLNAEQWSTDQNGFQHHLVAGHIPVPGSTQHWITPRVPALGLHSGHTSLNVLNQDPELKSSAFDPWRDAGLPVMTLNLEGVTHGDFGQDGSTVAGDARDVILRRVQHYTRAWFDLHLRDRATASNRLLAEEVGGLTRSELLSPTYISKAHLPLRQVTCEDFRTCQLPNPLPGGRRR